jgi:hypothetical protein
VQVLVDRHAPASIGIAIHPADLTLAAAFAQAYRR